MTTGEIDPTRDLSRAHWQRSVGAVVFREIGDQLFRDGDIPRVFTDVILERAGKRAKLTQPEDDPMWIATHSVLDAMLSQRAREMPMHNPVSSVIARELSRYTHYHFWDEVIEEGAQTQAHFPLNLARLISYKAADERRPGFELGNLGQIADMLRRPDFHRMVDQAALTRNGLWGHFGAKYAPPGDAVSEGQRLAHQSIVFGEDGSISFGDPLAEQFFIEMRKNNRTTRGVGYGVEVQSTSGCPARQKRPHFNGSETDRAALAALAIAHGKSVEELTETRETTTIDDGLNWMADMLDYLQKTLPAAYTKSEWPQGGKA